MPYGLTLWAAIVAERLAFDEDEVLTLGRALADDRKIETHEKELSNGRSTVNARRTRNVY